MAKHIDFVCVVMLRDEQLFDRPDGGARILSPGCRYNLKASDAHALIARGIAKPEGQWDEEVAAVKARVEAAAQQGDSEAAKILWQFNDATTDAGINLVLRKSTKKLNNMARQDAATGTSSAPAPRLPSPLPPPAKTKSKRKTDAELLDAADTESFGS